MDQEFTIEDLADEGVTSGVEAESHQPLSQPFDPSSVSIGTQVVSLYSVLRRIGNKTINLSPAFQRNSVWDRTRQSLLIESMMLRIPLPMFYVAEDRNGKWEVVDGLQRLTAIHEFVKGPDEDGKGFKLKDLEFWGKNYNGKTFFALEKMEEASMTVNHILETELQFTVIKPDTSEKVKRNIFKRINTGGMRLSEQEIRHALYQGPSTDLLSDLVKNDIYLDTIGQTINDSRMAGRELILRYIAFSIFGYQAYKGDMDDFLSAAMACLNDDQLYFKDSGFAFPTVVPTKKEIIQLFISGLERNDLIFGEHAFRKSFGKDRKTPINKSLFDVWMLYLSELTKKQFDTVYKNKKSLLFDYKELLQDVEFSNSISRHSGSISGVTDRHKKIKDLISKFI
ncbi:GmrSD restriction endonuclease domain-containing protein [Shewanella algae]|uniref:GmrSD restriction endonuclease domain-containing protein n=1 Tax=Shewanella algae TaxID=38313 RepID=UPI0006966508